MAQGQTPVVETIGTELQKQTKALNPQYLVFSPQEKTEKALPLVIYLHGGGGVGENVRKIRGQVTPQRGAAHV